jgi:8-amino-7-oxononanoate synthase
MSSVSLESPRSRLLAELSEELGELRAQGLGRRLICLEAVEGPCVRIDGRTVVSWCSNDYLGLSTHPALAQAAARAAAEWGVGARASRLLAGTTRWHAELEERLAAWFRAEQAIVFPTGYQANLGALGALLGSQDAVFIDRLAHASLVDAARATRASFQVFRHQDVGHLTALLARAPAARRRLIVTEGVFSMDGDPAPLKDLVEAAESHDALVYLDDAHGAFAAGPTGRGSPEAVGLAHERVLYMGTLGKALGCQGGFVIGPKTFIELLHHRARTFIYTTALAVPVAAAAVAALDVLAREPAHRERLWDRVARLREWMAAQLGSDTFVESQIVPVVVGTAEAALALAERLWEQGIWAPAIRPPSVPQRTARMRLSVTALHTDEQIDALVRALQK